MTASRPREAMDENRGLLFRIFPKHALNVVKGNIDAPGNMACPYSSSLRTSIKTAPSVARHLSTPLLIVAPVIRSIKLMRCSSSFFKRPRKAATRLHADVGFQLESTGKIPILQSFVRRFSCFKAAKSGWARATAPVICCSTRQPAWTHRRRTRHRHPFHCPQGPPARNPNSPANLLNATSI